MESSNLGSLAQSARGKSLNEARWILILVGVLTLGFQGYRIYETPNEVKEVLGKEVQELQRKGMMPNPADVKAAEENELRIRYLIYGVGAALGVVFLVLGLLVHTMPVVATVLGLVLYIGAYLAFGALNPANLYAGVIVKIFIVIALVKAIQAAIAYQKESAAAQDFAPEA